jgi:hypothetical protein
LRSMVTRLTSAELGSGPCSEINRCRACKEAQLEVLLDLGVQSLTGVFPADPKQDLTRGPLVLVLCANCGLVQLQHSFDRAELYGDNYGYRSSLNSSMVDHLGATVASLQNRVQLRRGDIVVDIGSNDGTLLSFYAPESLVLVGFDPCISKFREYYRSDIVAVPDFFSSDILRATIGSAGAKIITSIAMFYDLEDPIEFANNIRASLAPDGIWHFEQSYLPLMLEAGAYDTICHEHLEYYGVGQVDWILREAGLRILSVELNKVNGGSFAVTACRRTAAYESETGVIEGLLRREKDLALTRPEAYREFTERVRCHRDELRHTVFEINGRGERIFGYGASTKGNVILQYCGFGPSDIPVIAEVNAEKYGHFTPGTAIPIVPESEARAARPEYFLVLPWHFKANLIAREQEYLRSGGKLLFPLPQIETVTL